MNTNITKTWSFSIDEKTVLAKCTDESLYQAYNRSADNPKGDALVIQEDDMAQFHRYYEVAIANLRMILSTRIAEADEPTLGSSFSLQMHDNHDNNVLPILINHCYEYVVKKVLEQWYHADWGSELERLEIKHCIHYRKHPVRRRIGPLF